MIVVHHFAELEALLGKDLEPSSWHLITQEQINKFADATLDHQWIHTDTDRASAESPFKATIAHGYLTLSLVPYLWKQIVSFKNLKMEINYGIEELKFAQPAIVNSQVRLNVKLAEILNLRGVVKATFNTQLELKDQKKPAFTARITFLYHFNN